jgi:hypothetical protein
MMEDMRLNKYLAPAACQPPSRRYVDHAGTCYRQWESGAGMGYRVQPSDVITLKEAN